MTHNDDSECGGAYLAVLAYFSRVNSSPWQTMFPSFSSLFIFSLLPISLWAFTDYTPESFPDSITQPALCGISEPSFLCDPNGVLDNSTRWDLIHSLEAVQSRTRCSCDKTDSKYGQCDSIQKGFIFSIGVVPNMILDSDQRTDEYVLNAAQQFADIVRQRQQRGHCQDDIFIFYSSNNDVVYTSVGETAGVFFSNKVITDISNDAKNLLRKGKYSEGFNDMINNYVRVLNGEKAKLKHNHFYSPLPLWAFITICVVSGLILIGVLIGTIILLKKCCCKSQRSAEYQMGVRM